MSSYDYLQKQRPASRAGGLSLQSLHAVRVENLPLYTNCEEIAALFNTLIGDVSSVSDIKDTTGHHLDISFTNNDACKKALCMSGYTVSGHSLSVVLPTKPNTATKHEDGRRNLYVLGLPFDMSKMELTSVFSQYGTVSHCVILATVDSSSRRRGFVVMGCHDEAKLAITSLTRTQMRGNVLDISWAIVQRSQGFLDGGDRAVLFDSSHPPRVPSPDSPLNDTFPHTNTPNSSFDSHTDNSTLLLSTLPTGTILVSELPSLLFSQIDDLHPLLDPFGKIDSLEIVESLAVTPGTISVKVEYASIANAREALESLQGQRYVNFTLRAQYLQITLPLCFNSPSDPYPAMPPAMNFGPYRYSPSLSRRAYNVPLPRHSYAQPSTRLFRPHSRPNSVNSQWDNDFSRYPHSFAPYPSNVPLHAVPQYRAF